MLGSKDILGGDRRISSINSNLTHTIDGIFTYIWLNVMVNVGKYTSPMDAMG